MVSLLKGFVLLLSIRPGPAPVWNVAMKWIMFITLVLLWGRQYLATVGLAIGLDVVMVAVFVAHLLSLRHKVERSPAPTA